MDSHEYKAEDGSKRLRVRFNIKGDKSQLVVYAEVSALSAAAIPCSPSHCPAGLRQDELWGIRLHYCAERSKRPCLHGGGQQGHAGLGHPIGRGRLGHQQLLLRRKIVTFTVIFTHKQHHNMPMQLLISYLSLLLLPPRPWRS